MSARPWPPLIHADRVPGWIRARDLLLTIAAWAALTYWMRGALLLIYDWLSYPLFELSTSQAPDWSRIWLALAPFVGIAALLATWMVYWSVRRRRILRRQRSMPQPPSLDLEVHASQFGLHAPDVLSMREPRVVTVRFDASGAIAPLRV